MFFSCPYVACTQFPREVPARSVVAPGVSWVLRGGQVFRAMGSPRSGSVLCVQHTTIVYTTHNATHNGCVLYTQPSLHTAMGLGSPRSVR